MHMIQACEPRPVTTDAQGQWGVNAGGRASLQKRFSFQVFTNLAQCCLHPETSNNDGGSAHESDDSGRGAAQDENYHWCPFALICFSLADR